MYDVTHLQPVAIVSQLLCRRCDATRRWEFRFIISCSTKKTLGRDIIYTTIVGIYSSSTHNMAVEAGNAILVLEEYWTTAAIPALWRILPFLLTAAAKNAAVFNVGEYIQHSIDDGHGESLGIA